MGDLRHVTKEDSDNEVFVHLFRERADVMFCSAFRENYDVDKDKLNVLPSLVPTTMQPTRNAVASSVVNAATCGRTKMMFRAQKRAVKRLLRDHSHAADTMVVEVPFVGGKLDQSRGRSAKPVFVEFGKDARMPYLPDSFMDGSVDKESPEWIWTVQKSSSVCVSIMDVAVFKPRAGRVTPCWKNLLDDLVKSMVLLLNSGKQAFVPFKVKSKTRAGLKEEVTSELAKSGPILSRVFQATKDALLGLLGVSLIPELFIRINGVVAFQDSPLVEDSQHYATPQ
jgi:hypothetical protein